VSFCFPHFESYDCALVYLKLSVFFNNFTNSAIKLVQKKANFQHCHDFRKNAPQSS